MLLPATPFSTVLASAFVVVADVPPGRGRSPAYDLGLFFGELLLLAGPRAFAARSDLMASG